MPFKKGKTPEGAKPFEPGKSGNPAGLKPGTRHTKTLLRDLLAVTLEKENPLTKEKQLLTAEQLMHLGQIAKAINDNDTRAYEAVLDRIDGRPTQTIANDPENPFSDGGADVPGQRGEGGADGEIGGAGGLDDEVFFAVRDGARVGERGENRARVGHFAGDGFVAEVEAEAIGAGTADHACEEDGGGLISVPALLLAGASPVEALATNKLQGTFGAGGMGAIDSKKGRASGLS